MNDLVTGEEMLKELIRFKESSIFDEHEKRFIREILGKRFEELSKHQKAVVLRLYGWLTGG